jgi:2-iminoacetate synthase ThiH
MVPLLVRPHGLADLPPGQGPPGPTWDEVVLIHAVSRIAFDGLIDNIQARG